MEVEYEVELAYVLEEVVQYFHEEVYGFQVHQLVVCLVDAQGEVQPCVSPIH